MSRQGPLPTGARGPLPAPVAEPHHRKWLLCGQICMICAPLASNPRVAPCRLWITNISGVSQSGVLEQSWRTEQKVNNIAISLNFNLSN